VNPRRPPDLPRFPLARWIFEHRHLPHDLGQSGMRGEIRSYAQVLRDSAEGTPEELRLRLARLQRVPVDRLFLTHGATEANALVLLHLARNRHRRGGEPLRARIGRPEYPPLGDTARLVGLETVETGAPAEIAIASNPSNPEGTIRAAAQIRRFADGVGDLLVDETFREFTTAAPVSDTAARRLWRTASFTKAYGADDVRVGFVVVPRGEEESFRETHWLLDGIAQPSSAAAIALLRYRATLLGEVRRLFRRNLATLQELEGEVPPLAAPLWFDRPGGARGGDRLAEQAAKRGVLVSPGRFFGDRSGVRVCLTRSSFPDSIVAYRRVKAELGWGRSSPRR
jgi:histidinol-phosphate/aromatic aminotransferase/cobyric acid decarboxylase-like protein